ncbi:hypothetical protein D3C71_2224220 [compost metagenome]
MKRLQRFDLPVQPVAHQHQIGPRLDREHSTAAYAYRLGDGLHLQAVGNDHSVIS